MATCRICQFETYLDDVALGTGPERCICLRCALRATGALRPMPTALQRTVERLLLGSDGAHA